LAATVAGAVTAASGAKLLRAIGITSPKQSSRIGCCRVGMTNDPAKCLGISGKSRFTPATCCLVHSGPPTGQAIGSNARLVIAT
jgi:hypothetical protein